MGLATEMKKETHYYVETRECTYCGKRSRIRTYGAIVSILGISMFNVTRWEACGKVEGSSLKDIGHMECPKCRTKHGVQFDRKKPDTFPCISGGRTYYEV
jgi:hypothetical protein